jgi:hypothetical protein
MRSTSTPAAPDSVLKGAFELLPEQDRAVVQEHLVGTKPASQRVGKGVGRSPDVLASVIDEHPGPWRFPLGQILADVATIGILQERAIRRGEIVNEQLQAALNSRVVIEQAKGAAARNSGWTKPSPARRNNLCLSYVARLRRCPARRGSPHSL